MIPVIKILVALLTFGLIIFIHELGHFIVARLMKVKVNEFSMGMGPVLLKFGKKGTVYSLRLFPFGGFCAMEGEDQGAPMPQALGGNGMHPETQKEDLMLEQQPDVKRKKNTEGPFYSKKVWRRFLIVVAGAVMNLLLGFVVLVVNLAVCTEPMSNGKTAYPSTQIADFYENALSQQTGLAIGDEIVSINGKRVITDRDLSMLLQSDEDGVFDMTVIRNGQKTELAGVTFQLLPNRETGKNTLVYDFKVLAVEQTIGSTLQYAAKLEVSFGIMVWRSLADLVSGKYGLNDLSGPVGTMDVIGDAVAGINGPDWREGLSRFLFLLALITINVGIFNLLPLPALDGGRLVFLVIEGIIRKPVPQKIEGVIHAVGMILLLLLMAIVTFSDITKLFM